MAKNILAFFGLIFLTLLIVLTVLLVGLFYDRLGIISLPAGILSAGIIETPMSLLTPGPVEVRVNGVGQAQWTNPLDALPSATWTPNPTPTPRPTQTPIPPMDPADYRGQVLSRMKSFAAALQKWLDANNQLAQNNSLLEDPTWTGAMKGILEEIDLTGAALAQVGPAPLEYQGIDSWLKRISSEAHGLNRNYTSALGSGGAQGFAAAGQNFTRIKEDLTQAVNGMIKTGWSLQ